MIRFDTRTDGDLVAAFARSRCEAAFAELVRRHGPRVLRACRCLVGHADADDVFQATFLVLARNAGRVRAGESVGSYLLGVAGRVGRKHRRRSFRVFVTSERTAPPADVRAGHTDLARVLAEELARLPDTLRGPVVVCLLDGRPQADAVRELGCSERTLRRRLDRAKDLLRVRLTGRGVAPAAAAGLLAGFAETTCAVPPGVPAGLAMAATDYLAGAATSPAALLASGVGAMSFRTKMAAAVVLAAGMLTGVGVGTADDKAKQVDPAQPPAAKPVAPPRPGVPDPAEEKMIVKMAAVMERVTAPHPAATRAVKNEAHHLFQTLSKEWCGTASTMEQQKVLMDITFTGGGETTRPHGELELLYSSTGDIAAKLQVGGPLEKVLDEVMPQKMVQFVMAAHFRRTIPRWAETGVGMLEGGKSEQSDAYLKCAELLNGGRAYTLKVILANGPPVKNGDYNMMIQGYALTKFLVAKKGKKAFVTFLGELRAKSEWDAVRNVYGYDSIDELQAAWIDWFRQNPPTGRGDDGRDDPTRIPPVNLGK